MGNAIAEAGKFQFGIVPQLTLRAGVGVAGADGTKTPKVLSQAAGSVDLQASGLIAGVPCVFLAQPVATLSVAPKTDTYGLGDVKGKFGLELTTPALAGLSASFLHLVMAPVGGVTIDTHGRVGGHVGLETAIPAGREVGAFGLGVGYMRDNTPSGQPVNEMFLSVRWLAPVKANTLSEDAH